MTQPANTLDTYDINDSIREELSKIITDTSPTATPFMTNIRQGKPTGNRTVEWLVDGLAAAAENAQIEGDDYAGTALTPPTRLNNVTQISAKSVVISDTALASDSVERASGRAYQLRKNGAELKRDVERALTGREITTAGSSTAARKMAGMPTWIRTNTDGYNTNAAPTRSGGTPDSAGTTVAARGLTELDVQEAATGAFENSDSDSWILFSTPKIHRSFTNYTFSEANPRIAAQRQDQGGGRKGKGVTLRGMVQYYESPYGPIELMADRFLGVESATKHIVSLIDPDTWELKYFKNRKYAVKRLGPTGDGEKWLIRSEYTLCAKSEESNATIVAINPATAVIKGS